MDIHSPDTKLIFTIISAVLFAVAFYPYVRTILQGKTKPSKASWLIWFSLDTIVIVGMYFKGTVNGQIATAVLGGGLVFTLSLFYGKPGWTTLDKWCIGFAVCGVALWIGFSEPTFGIVVSNIVMFIAAFPTFKSALDNPEQEDRLAWTIFWLSCVAQLLAVNTWTLDEATQPLTFFAVESVVMYLLFVHPRKAKSAVT